jgi:hypothetical protein
MILYICKEMKLHMELIMMKMRNSYETYIEKNLVIIQVSSKEEVLDIAIDIEDFQTISSLSHLKSVKTNGRRLIYGVTQDGKSVPLHRLIAKAEENEEVLILNEDFTDLRLINLKKVPKGTGKLEDAKERLARNIKPVKEVLNELNIQDLEDEERDAATSPSSNLNLDIAPSLFSNKVVVHLNERQFPFESLSKDEKAQLIELISSLKLV